MRTRHKIGAIVVAAVLLVAGATTAVIANKDSSKNASAPKQTSVFGVWYLTCTLDHSAMDDPIVHPNMPGGSHMHDFFGAKGVDAFTKPADKVGGATTCAYDGGATGAYWFPALYSDGVKVDPLQVDLAYTAGGKDRNTVKPFPAGLVMVAGSLVPPGSPTGFDKTDWDCNPDSHPYSSSQVLQACPADNNTIVRLPYPDCWDGVHLDSQNHRSHMAYSERPANAKGTTPDVCPADHPVPVPQISARVIYPKGVTGTMTLASGDTSTWHGDFMNSWDQDELTRLTNTCIVASKLCGKADLQAGN